MQQEAIQGIDHLRRAAPSDIGGISHCIEVGLEPPRGGRKNQGIGATESIDGLLGIAHNENAGGIGIGAA